MRRAIAATMTASAAVPQFTLERSVGVDGIQALRARQKAAGSPVSIEDVLIAAAAATLREHPGVNASFTEDGIVHHAEINVGFAVALPGGLISPAILGTDALSLEEIAAARVRLRDAAHDGHVRGPELMGATFTISNLGPLGVERFQALVIPPQAAILAVGTARDGRLNLALSSDHRVLDGAPSALFLGALCERLEDPA